MKKMLMIFLLALSFNANAQSVLNKKLNGNELRNFLVAEINSLGGRITGKFDTFGVPCAIQFLPSTPKEPSGRFWLALVSNNNLMIKIPIDSNDLVLAQQKIYPDGSYEKVFTLPQVGQFVRIVKYNDPESGNQYYWTINRTQTKLSCVVQ